MKILFLSYHYIHYQSPDAWLKRISFYTGILEEMAHKANVSNLNCIDFEGSFIRNGVNYHFVKFKKLDLLFPFRLHAYIKEHILPDVIVVHGLRFPLQVILLRMKFGRNIKIVAQHHAEKPFSDLRKYLQKIADSFIAFYLFASHDLGSTWITNGIIRKQEKIIEVMEASSSFRPIERSTAKQHTNIPDNDSYLWVGRLDENKDPLLVVRAFIKFLEIHKTAKLYIIFQEDHLLEDIKQVLNKYPQAQTAIMLVGKVNHDDLLFWYNSVDFIISSSHYEGSGIAVCEAMSCGCIPILTNIASFRMMTKQGDCGLLYEAGNVAGLINALIKSVSMKKANERDNVLKNFQSHLSFKAIADKIHFCIDS